jgi:hypothetical protein
VSTRETNVAEKTAHNRSVYASPPVGGSASIRLAQSLRSFARLTPAHCPPPQCYALLYRGAGNVVNSLGNARVPGTFLGGGRETRDKEEEPSGVKAGRPLFLVRCLLRGGVASGPVLAARSVSGLLRGGVASAA